MLLLLLTSYALAIGPPARYYAVDQDHFDGSNNHTWMQAYFVNDTFWKPGSSAPVFICVGGEGPPLDGSAVVYSVHCNDAVEMLHSTGAIMFAVEHRYYGCHNASACPVPDVQAPGALKFLSSRQALGDLAAFVQFIRKEYKLTSANKLVSWGGSYPGMLAGWFRLKFPHLAHAAVASSAPVLAQLDMAGYNNVVAAAFSVSDNNVGGSPACTKAIAAGHKAIGALMQNASGRQLLAPLFKLPSADWLADIQNQKNFAGEGVADFYAQSNDPSCTEPACNIASICKIMLNTALGDEVHRLAAVRAAQGGQVRPQRQLFRSLKHSRALRARGEPDYWGYQTCTEFAFYQTCEVGSQCPFTQGLILLDDFLSECRDSWGISEDKVISNVNYTNQYYGGLNPAGTRVLFTSGEVDPWQALSIRTAPNPQLAAFTVMGASHHFWTHPSLPSDQKSVVQARGTIWSQVSAWLKDA